MQLPLALLKSLKDVKGFNRKSFEEVHASGEQITSIRINPLKAIGNRQWATSNNIAEQIPWTEFGYYLKKRPSFTFDPLFHAGTYYVQEASSMFLEQALKQTVDLSQPLRILDLSAAPGGKSTHIQSLISDKSLLVSNDTIRSRANILKDNIVKWGSNNVVVTNNDPRDFAQLENFFDVIVVDAPCSGSGLFRRDPEAIDEWSENNVQLCSQRQQRILMDVWPALKKDGLLVYSTCSYSRQEDEDISGWLLRELPVSYCSLLVHPDWGIIETGQGYRFWPDKVKGEGFFIACFKKREGDYSFNGKTKTRPAEPTGKEKGSVLKWTDVDFLKYIKHESTVYGWPLQQATDFGLLLERFRVIYSGTRMGDLTRDKLIPDHALAMSPLVSTAIPRIALNPEQAIAYLQRKELVLAEVAKGWHLVTFQEQALGWVNVLPNRINNYYPRELRILKDN